MNSMMIYFHHLSAVLLVMIFKFSDCHLLCKKIIMIELHFEIPMFHIYNVCHDLFLHQFDDKIIEYCVVTLLIIQF